MLSAGNQHTVGIIDNLCRSALCRCADRGERRVLRKQVNECTLARAVTGRKKSNSDLSRFVKGEIKIGYRNSRCISGPAILLCFEM
jgi:hypothetical protein